MSRPLRTPDEIAAAGAAAVADWPALTEGQVDEVVALLAPALDDITAAQQPATDRAQPAA